MQYATWRWFGVGSCAAVLGMLAACSSSNAPRVGGTEGSEAEPNSGATTGRPDDPAFGGGGGSDGGGGPVHVVCNPSPDQFDIPGNGCDEDGDGQADNEVTCDQGLAVDGDGYELAKALGLCHKVTGPADPAWGVVSAEFTRGPSTAGQPEGDQHGILPKFGFAVKPREGGAMAVLSSGVAREFNSTTVQRSFRDGWTMKGSGSVPAGYPKAAQGCPVSTAVSDVISLKLKIKVPSNAQGVAFDFDFYSSEWPSYVCTQFNDGFIAMLTSSAFNGGQPANISFDANNNPVSVNNGFFDRCTPNTETGCAVGGVKKTSTCPGGENELLGTGFEARNTYCGGKNSTGGGATGWLSSQAPVTPGETITIEFFIWDTGDADLDSSVLLDHLTWVPTPTQTETRRPPPR